MFSGDIETSLHIAHWAWYGQGHYKKACFLFQLLQQKIELFQISYFNILYWDLVMHMSWVGVKVEVMVTITRTIMTTNFGSDQWLHN